MTDLKRNEKHIEKFVKLIEDVSKKINNQFEIELPTFRLSIDNNIFRTDITIYQLNSNKENTISCNKDGYFLYGMIVIDFPLLEKELKEVLND
jgi:hypothetical protein